MELTGKIKSKIITIYDNRSSNILYDEETQMCKKFNRVFSFEDEEEKEIKYSQKLFDCLETVANAMMGLYGKMEISKFDELLAACIEANN